jgi:uncharacterized membrane protein YgcG
MPRLTRIAALTGWVLVLAPAAAVLAATPPGAPPAGPPYPRPINDVVVYDYAHIFSDQTEASATRIIVAIEERVAAEVVVYTQLKPGATTESTQADAAALIDQWGVGRQGFDDGLAILVNMTRSPCQPGLSGNGQVQLFGAPGYRAAYLSDDERQEIFDNEMVPLLAQCDLDGALLAALHRIDANATPEHAAVLASARIIDAAIALVIAPLLFLILVGMAARSWLLYGKDPVYLDSPSILMPAPPPDLTAAAGAVVWEGRGTRRALTTALLDLASRGELAFRPEGGSVLSREKAGIQLGGGETSDPYVIRNRRKPLSQAERYALSRLDSLARSSADRYITAAELEGFAPSVDKFNETIEKHVASKGWFREPAHKAVSRWAGRGTLIVFAGIVTLGIAFTLPSGGLLVLGGATIAAGVVIIIVAQVMPARTMAGAMIYAMLAAYRRTLQKTMEQARSMREVVEQAQLEWLETPDQAVVWGVALGLHREVEEVLERSVEDAQAGVQDHHPWVPAWYASSSGLGGGSGQPSGIAPGLFSASAVPNFGGMMAALGTIGVSSASSSGGSGGFSGGSSGGGGGGGAGGGF